MSACSCLNDCLRARRNSTRESATSRWGQTTGDGRHSGAVAVDLGEEVIAEEATEMIDRAWVRFDRGDYAGSRLPEKSARFRKALRQLLSSERIDRRATGLQGLMLLFYVSFRTEAWDEIPRHIQPLLGMKRREEFDEFLRSIMNSMQVIAETNLSSPLYEAGINLLRSSVFLEQMDSEPVDHFCDMWRSKFGQ